jgi:hypothetical protein
LTKLIGVAGLFVYPPAAIVALGDLGDSGHGCARMLRGGAAPEPEWSVVQKVKKGVGDAADALSRGLGRLFGG